MGRPKIPIEEEKVAELASVGCSAEEIASPLTPPGSKRPIDHRTIERRFAPALKKGRHQNNTNTNNGISIPILFCSAKSHRAPVIALTSCSACSKPALVRVARIQGRQPVLRLFQLVLTPMFPVSKS